MKANLNKIQAVLICMLYRMLTVIGSYFKWRHTIVTPSRQYYHDVETLYCCCCCCCCCCYWCYFTLTWQVSFTNAQWVHWNHNTHCVLKSTCIYYHMCMFKQSSLVSPGTEMVDRSFHETVREKLWITKVEEFLEVLNFANVILKCKHSMFAIVFFNNTTQISFEPRDLYAGREKYISSSEWEFVLNYE